MPLEEKLETLALKVYHAKTIDYSEKAQAVIAQIKQLGLSHLPICVAKTQYSISDDAKKLGYPKNTTLHVTDIKINAGAGFLTILLGNIMTMPGLPKKPNYEKIDLINGKIKGIF